MFTLVFYYSPIYCSCFFFFFNDTATTEIYTLSLHDALPISIARHGAPFTREEEDLLEYLAGQAVVSIENASLHEAVERQAVTDELTGLANARAFFSALDRELERGRRFATPVGLVMVDLDNFKRVNDSYGHQQGDEVLAQVAGVLRYVTRELDTPARYGGE